MRLVGDVVHQRIRQHMRQMADRGKHGVVLLRRQADVSAPHCCQQRQPGPSAADFPAARRSTTFLPTYSSAAARAILFAAGNRMAGHELADLAAQPRAPPAPRRTWCCRRRSRWCRLADAVRCWPGSRRSAPPARRSGSGRRSVTASATSGDLADDAQFLQRAAKVVSWRPTPTTVLHRLFQSQAKIRRSGRHQNCDFLEHGRCFNKDFDSWPAASSGQQFLQCIDESRIFCGRPMVTRSHCGKP